MQDLLYNPVFNALLTGDSRLGGGTATAKYYEEEVSPFVGFTGSTQEGFRELRMLLPAERRILFASPQLINEPADWKIKVHIPGLQFVWPAALVPALPALQPTALVPENIPEMLALTALTKPGPFDRRTIEFGHYYGIFENGRLAAMTGQRMHVQNHTEISAVCTHPEFLGKGYAAALLLHQLHLILAHNQLPFLHVRDDNSRAIALYERLGFQVNRPMHFYFMSRP